MRTPVTSYEDLEVWQVAMNLAEAIYALTTEFPPEERYGLTAQIRRAAVSIPSNIAEGYGRDQTGSFVQFLRISQGSARELETQLKLAVRLKLVVPGDALPAQELCTSVCKMLRSFIRKLDQRA